MPHWQFLTIPSSIIIVSPLFWINIPAFTSCLAAELSVGALAVSFIPFTFRLDRLSWCGSRICYCNVDRLVVAVSNLIGVFMKNIKGWN